MTEDMKRLLTYAKKFVPNGEWTPNGEDAEESLDKLEKLGLINRNEDGTMFRLDESEIETIVFTVPVNSESGIIREVEATNAKWQTLIDAVVTSIETNNFEKLKEIARELLKN